MQIKIIAQPNDMPEDIEITDEHGSSIEGIAELNITILPDQAITANVRFCDVWIRSVTAEASFDREQVKRMAEACGYRVESADTRTGSTLGPWAKSLLNQAPNK